MNRITLFLLTLALVAVSCAESAEIAPTFEPASVSTVDVQPKGERILSIDVTDPADGDYDAALSVAIDAGAQAIGLSLGWDDLETAPDVYNPDPNFLAIANAYYPTRNIMVDLVINPIDTNQLRLPADLQGRPFDDPEVIARFNALLDFVFTQIPDLELISLSIGNEIDGYLGADSALWAQYAAFFAATSAHARTLRPNLVVGAKGMFEGITGESAAYFQSVNQYSDAVLATYYPLKADFSVQPLTVIQKDFDSLVSAAAGKPVFLLETGYPSSAENGSSEQRQAEFITEVFHAWDAHADQIRVISFTWLNDIPPAAVKEFENYYGFSNKGFAAYLGSLGLRRYDGSAKPALNQLSAEARARGW